MTLLAEAVNCLYTSAWPLSFTPSLAVSKPYTPAAAAAVVTFTVERGPTVFVPVQNAVVLPVSNPSLNKTLGPGTPVGVAVGVSTGDVPPSLTILATDGTPLPLTRNSM
jgi:hypothetical protein